MRSGQLEFEGRAGILAEMDEEVTKIYVDDNHIDIKLLSSSSPRIYYGAQALEEEYLTYSETLPYIPSIKDLSLSKTSAQVITSPSAQC